MGLIEDAETPKGYRWITQADLLAKPEIYAHLPARQFDAVRGAYLMPDGHNPDPEPGAPLAAGVYVRKVAGYHFDGVVLACCSTTRGEVRVLVENGDGMLHIFDPKQLVADPAAKERMEARRASYPDRK